MVKADHAARADIAAIIAAKELAAKVMSGETCVRRTREEILYEVVQTPAPSTRHSATTNMKLHPLHEAHITAQCAAAYDLQELLSRNAWADCRSEGKQYVEFVRNSRRAWVEGSDSQSSNETVGQSTSCERFLAQLVAVPESVA